MNDYKEIKTAILDLLIKARKDKKITQQEVSNYLGVKQSSFSDLEKGKTDLSLETFLKLVNYYDIPDLKNILAPEPEPAPAPKIVEIELLQFLLNNAEHLERIAFLIGTISQNTKKYKDSRIQLNLKPTAEQKELIVQTARSEGKTILGLFLHLLNK